MTEQQKDHPYYCVVDGDKTYMGTNPDVIKKLVAILSELEYPEGYVHGTD